MIKGAPGVVTIYTRKRNMELHLKGKENCRPSGESLFCWHLEHVNIGDVIPRNWTKLYICKAAICYFSPTSWACIILYLLSEPNRTNSAKKSRKLEGLDSSKLDYW